MSAASQPDLVPGFEAALARELDQSGAQLDVATALRAAAIAARETLMRRWAATQTAEAARDDGGPRRVHYLSMEFLMGRSLGNALAALGLAARPARGARARRGIALPDVLEREPDAALGNGGLGRLAACFLDSMADARHARASATASATNTACSRRRSRTAQQVEQPDDWLRRRQPVGDRRAPNDAYTGALRRPRRAQRERRPRCDALWRRAPGASRRPTTRRSPATAPTPSTPCGCGRPRRRRTST